MKLTVVICTHNRAALLEKTLASLNQALRPQSCTVGILVVANACTDGTHAFLDAYVRRAPQKNELPLRWIAEPVPGKSYALNRAIRELDGDIVAYVDDDHRVDASYLAGICRAAHAHPDATMFCGRILPDWDGREPLWARDTGPYRIYPLPVPQYDLGPAGRRIGPEGKFPGGGNLVLRREVFARVGGFSTDLGPKGHDLLGGEDSEFVLRALTAGETLRYVPEILQYHYVDTARFSLGYVLQKSYQRSRSVARIHHADGSIPRYLWRKLGGYLGSAVFSLNWPRTRFYLVRLAATLGEIRGMAESPLTPGGPPPVNLAETAPGLAPVAVAMATAVAAALAVFPAAMIGTGLAVAAGVGLLVTLLLTAKSIKDFSRTGPQIQDEVRRHYSGYSFLALLRLGFWSLSLSGLMAAAGIAVYACYGAWLGQPPSVLGALATAALGVGAVTALQFCRHLLYLPATIAASSHYRLSRFYSLWRLLSPDRLRVIQVTLIVLGGGAALAGAALLVEQMRWISLALFAGLGVAAVAAGVRMLAPQREPSEPPARPERELSVFPNIIMIGSDTLRADRLGAAGYDRRLTPNLDALARRGTQFTHCYTPCARTAPSLLSLFTGTWPHSHGVRDNFVGDDQLALHQPALPAILASAGYQTATVGDWSAGDLGKFDFGFGITDIPKDQWNIKYLIRQGPKDLRLFLSLFTHNRFGKRFLPELYYLAGVPLTREVGSDARALMTRLATKDKPFLLNVFMATTHPPFGSEYPYYTMFAEPSYRGESKFVMARLTDPFEIIRRQGDGRKEFDLEQIIDLYDGCVKCFDDEVARILAHVDACGLSQDTIIVIYSDHGMEFFEHGTWGQGNSAIGDASPRVPLIIADPRRQGTAPVSGIVRMVDVAPTLLEMAGIAQPAKMDGVSLTPFLDGAGTAPDLPAFNETGIWLADLPGVSADHLRYPNLIELLEVPDKRSGTLAIKPEFSDVVVEAKDRMIRSGRWKLIYQPMHLGAVYQLFDTEDDPECRTDVAGRHPEVFSALKERLVEWMVQDTERVWRNEHLVPRNQ